MLARGKAARPAVAAGATRRRFHWDVVPRTAGTIWEDELQPPPTPAAVAVAADPASIMERERDVPLAEATEEAGGAGATISDGAAVSAAAAPPSPPPPTPRRLLPPVPTVEELFPDFDDAFVNHEGTKKKPAPCFSGTNAAAPGRGGATSGCGGDGAAMTADGDGQRGGEATPKPKRVALIGAKKAQNLNIMLAHFGKLTFAALARAVNELDERGVMGLEGVTNLLDFVPARDETDAVRRYVSDGGDTALLGKVSSAGSWFVAVPPRCRMEPYPVSPDPSVSPPPTVWCHEAELFTLAISEVDSLGERLVAMKAKCTFDEEAGALRASLSALRAACRALRSASGAAALRAFLGK